MVKVKGLGVESPDISSKGFLCFLDGTQDRDNSRIGDNIYRKMGHRIEIVLELEKHDG